MATKFDPAEAEPALSKILDSMSQTAVELMKMSAGALDARARRSAAVADRLGGALGVEDPRVLALRRSSDESRRLARDLSRGVASIGVKAPPPGSVTLTGRVTDAAGAVIPEVRVRLTDRAGTLDVAGVGTTDETGAFFFAVPPEAMPSGTELFLVVEDAKGRVLQTSPEPVRIEPSVLQRVDVAVQMRQPEREAQAGRALRKAAKATSRKRSK